MTHLAEIRRPLYLDGPFTIDESSVAFSIYPDREGYTAELEKVAIPCDGWGTWTFTRVDLCKLYGELRIAAEEERALEAWLEYGPEAIRDARAEERYDLEVAA